MYLLVSPFSIADGIGPWLDADYGVLTDTHLRVFKGEALYRDIHVAYPPATSYLIVFLFRIFGDNLLTLRVTLALVGATVAFLAFYFSRQLTSISCALAVTVIIFLAGPICINYPYPNWFCLSLGLCMVLVEHIGWKKKSAVCHLLAGLIAGTIFSFKENWGAFALIALLCTQFFEGLLASENPSEPSAGKTKAFVLLIGAVGSLLAFSLILIRENFTILNIIVFSLPSCVVFLVATLALVIRLREDRGVHIMLFPMVYACSGFAIVVLPWVIYFLVRLGPDGFYKGLIQPLIVHGGLDYAPFPTPSPEALLLVVLASCQGVLILRKKALPLFKPAFVLVLGAFCLFLAYKMIPFIREGMFTAKTGKYSNWGLALACYIPLATHIGLGFVFMRDFRDPGATDRNHLHLSLSLWIYSIATFSVFYPVMEAYHFIPTLPPVIVLGNIFIFRSFRFWELRPRDAFWGHVQKTIKFCSAMIVPVFLGLFLGLPIFNFFVRVDPAPFRVRISEFSDIDSPRGGILMPKSRADSISAVVNFVRAHTDPDEYIFDMTGSFFYFLTDRPNPTRWENTQPGFLSPQDIGELRNRLETIKPAVVVNSYTADWKFSYYYPDVYSYIHARYKPLETYGDYRIMVFKGEPLS